MTARESRLPIELRSGSWAWKPVPPEPEVGLHDRHILLWNPESPDLEMRVEVAVGPDGMSASGVKSAAVRPYLRRWVDEEGELWTVWPPEEEGIVELGSWDAGGMAGPVETDGELIFRREGERLRAPVSRPLGELTDGELQELLEGAREPAS